MHCFDESDTFHLLFMSPEKSDSLLQALYIVRYSHPGIARIAYPSAKRPGLMTVIELETRRFTAALAEAISRVAGAGSRP